MSQIFQQYMREMDDYHFISKCSENYLSDTRVTKIFLSVSAQGLRKNDKKITGPNGRTGKCCDKVEFHEIILSFFPLFLITNNNKNTSINSQLKLDYSQCIIFQSNLVTASNPEFSKPLVLLTNLPPITQYSLD